MADIPQIRPSRLVNNIYTFVTINLLVDLTISAYERTLGKSELLFSEMDNAEYFSEKENKRKKQFRHREPQIMEDDDDGDWQTI